MPIALAEGRPLGLDDAMRQISDDVCGEAEHRDAIK
jgi:hypothetical protein